MVKNSVRRNRLGEAEVDLFCKAGMKWLPCTGIYQFYSKVFCLGPTQAVWQLHKGEDYWGSCPETDFPFTVDSDVGRSVSEDGTSLCTVDILSTNRKEIR